MYILFLYMSCVLMLSGCLNIHKRSHKQSMKRTHVESGYTLQESIARIHDIPDVPFEITIQKIIYAQDQPQQYQIVGNIKNNTELKIKDIISYYTTEMERYGWKELAFYEAVDEIILLFGKPYDVFCSVMLSGPIVKITMLKKETSN